MITTETPYKLAEIIRDTWPNIYRPSKQVKKPIDSQGRVINTWADVLNRAGLGMEVMHERNAHNFPLDLAAAESTPVALTAPAIG
jgi:hypothetical protein